jgi:hypothetical protein
MFNSATDVLYSRARERGQRGQLWSALSGRSRCLLSLEKVDTHCTVDARTYAGIDMVPVCQICGTEGRSVDFDRDFNPLQDNNRERWLSIAGAWERGKKLPPVALIRVDDVYFVRDGHHRISVAQALGQRHIQAKVMVWQVSGLLPWEMRTRKTRGDRVRLIEGLLLSLSDRLAVVGSKLRARTVS